jgi:hypothetical protein
MKQLLLTFFAVILCYSLFFGKEDANPAVDEINYIYEKVSTPNYHSYFQDSMNYLTFYSGTEAWSKDCYLPVFDNINYEKRILQKAN